MAPSATETVTETAPAATQSLKTTYFGAYKALAPVSYSKDAELGKNGHKGAKVSLPPNHARLIC
jgi:hypothetical protein